MVSAGVRVTVVDVHGAAGPRVSQPAVALVPPGRVLAVTAVLTLTRSALVYILFTIHTYRGRQVRFNLNL